MMCITTSIITCIPHYYLFVGEVGQKKRGGQKKEASFIYKSTDEVESIAVKYLHHMIH
jgi:hypothetical protein